MLILPLSLASLLPIQERSPLLVVSPAGDISRSTTAAFVADRVPLVVAPVSPLAVELSSSSRTLWVVHEQPAGVVVASRVDLADGTLHDRTAALPCAAVSDVAAPLEGANWFIAEPLGSDARIWRGSLPKAYLSPWITLVGRPEISGLSLGLDGRLYAYDAIHQVLLAIDTATGTYVEVGPTGLTAGAPRGLDVDPATGDLFGVFEVPGVEPRLGRVDSSSGAVVLLETLQSGPAPWLAIERDTRRVGTSAVPSAAGAVTSVRGSARREANDLVLEAEGLPTHSFGLFLAGRVHRVPAAVGPGALCLEPPMGRLGALSGQLLPTGARGAMRRAVDLGAVDLGAGVGPVGPTELLHFQAWAREGAAGPTFATSVSVPLASQVLGSIAPDPAREVESPGRLVAGDLDGDGDLDVLRSERSNRWILERTNASGGYSEELQQSMGAVWDPLSVGAMLGDVDGDLDLDLLMTHHSGGALAIHRNDGTGTLGPSMSFATCHRMGQLHVRDIDGDGRVDVAYNCRYSNRVLIFYGGAQGPEWPHVVPLSAIGGDLEVFDLDQDGRPDLIVPDAQGTRLLVLRQAQARQFVELPPVAAPVAAPRCSVADVLPGGHPELVCWREFPSSLTIHSLDMGFTLPHVATRTIPRFTDRPRFQDIDGDGVVDVVGAWGGVQLLRNDGQGEFSFYDHLDAPFSSLEYVIADLDVDGRLDAVVSSLISQGVVLRLEQGPAGWPHRHAVSLPPSTIVRALEDLDGDGYDDVVFSGGSDLLHVARGLGAGAFGLPVAVASDPSAYVDLQVGDIDGDGDRDLVGLGRQSIQVVENLGAMQFGPPRIYPSPGFWETLGLGDLHSDGDLDVLVGGTGVLSWWRNDGSGGLTLRGNRYPPLQIDRITVTDVDGDGVNDIALECAVWQAPRMQVYFATGGLYDLPTTIVPSGVIGAGPLVDVDDDGLLDVVGERVFLNPGGRRLFLPPLPGVLGGNHTVGDVDSDGWVDVVSDRSYGVAVRRGLGRGQFGVSEPFVGPIGGYPKVFVRDTDRDGLLDVVFGPSSPTGGPLVYLRAPKGR